MSRQMNLQVCMESEGRQVLFLLSRCGQSSAAASKSERCAEGPQVYPQPAILSQDCEDGGDRADRVPSQTVFKLARDHLREPGQRIHMALE